MLRAIARVVKRDAQLLMFFQLNFNLLSLSKQWVTFLNAYFSPIIKCYKIASLPFRKTPEPRKIYSPSLFFCLLLILQS